MKRFIALILAATLCLSLCACVPDPEPVTTFESPLPSYADITACWGQGLGNGDYENWDDRRIIGDRIVATAYSSENALAGFDVAIGDGRAYKIKYIGMKDALPQPEPYYPFSYFAQYDYISCAEYEILDGPLESVRGSYLLTTEAVLGEGLVSFTIPYDEDTDTVADGLTPKKYLRELVKDVDAAEKLQGGRKVIDADILAMTGGEGRLGLFRYENTDDGLFSIIYVKGERVLAADFPSAYLDEYGATWRADLNDEPGWFTPIFILNAQEGLLIGLNWAAPEGEFLVILREEDGKLARDKWWEQWKGYYHDTFSGEFYYHPREGAVYE